jgi:hypothetical protein
VSFVGRVQSYRAQVEQSSCTAWQVVEGSRGLVAWAMLRSLRRGRRGALRLRSRGESGERGEASIAYAPSGAPLFIDRIPSRSVNPALDARQRGSAVSSSCEPTSSSSSVSSYGSVIGSHRYVGMGGVVALVVSEIVVCGYFPLNPARATLVDRSHPLSPHALILNQCCSRRVQRKVATHDYLRHTTNATTALGAIQ